MLLLNALTVLQKVIQSLPNFISPYLKSILVQVILFEIFELIVNIKTNQCHWLIIIKYDELQKVFLML